MFLADIFVDMALLRRHKYVITLLLIYWPAIFIATHIPVPLLARKSGMSDKTMHFLAYLVLVFFWWFTISPYSKVNWRKVKVWLTLVVMVWYGAFDEWLQGRVGRSADVMDFFADLSGTLAGLVILTIFNFWLGSLTVTVIFIFTISNLSKIDLIWELPFVNTGFHFLGYIILTLIWIQNMHRHIISTTQKRRHVKWLLTASVFPVALLVIVKLCSVGFGKQVWFMDCLTAFTGIIAAVLTSYLACFSYSEEVT